MTDRLSFLVTAAVIAATASLAASAGAATVSKSPFCFAGSPTPKYVCDAIKANTKPKPAPQRVKVDTAKPALQAVR